MARPAYPPSHQSDVVDIYHGTPVNDPYRWLEEDDSPATQEWTAAQNALTRAVLDTPARGRLRHRLKELYDYPRSSVPIRRAARYFFVRNSGLQNQPVLLVQDGPAGVPRTLVDPNALAADGTIALTALAASDDGRLVAYGLSERGSDRQDILVCDVDTSEHRPDRVRWAKFTSLAWAADGTGFFYTRFPEPGTVPPGDEQYFCQVRFHRLGDDQANDRLIYERPDDREVVFQVAMTADGRDLVIESNKGASDRSEVHVLPVDRLDAAPMPLFTGFSHAYHFIEAAEGRLYFQTDEGAPRGRVIAVARSRSGGEPTEIVPESPDKLSQVAIAHRTLVAAYLRNASDRVRLFDPSGKPAGEIVLPALGSVFGLSGRPDDDELFLGFTSYTHPPTVLRYETGSGRQSTFAASSPRIDPAAYETRQVRYTSRDGTPVSMFLVHRRGLALDGDRPVLLTGYGGFNISLTPAFDPSAFIWLDAGGVYAVANLRGGGEYGEAWHEAGMRERKPRVFDDFFGAAEWLIAQGYTRPRRLAIEGGSNGGLLVGAALVQRPDLFGAVVCRVPVADMLRYHHFTVGRFWIPEYGSSDDPAMFRVLLAYSPLHNVRDGAPYPATLVMTADTDDRVAPGMARKFAARLQAATGGDAPILIRIEMKAGHGAGKPVSKLIDEDADIFAFLFGAMEIR